MKIDLNEQKCNPIAVVHPLKAHSEPGKTLNYLFDWLINNFFTALKLSIESINLCQQMGKFKCQLPGSLDLTNLIICS